VIVIPSKSEGRWRRDAGAPVTPATSFTNSIKRMSAPRRRSIDRTRGARGTAGAGEGDVAKWDLPGCRGKGNREHGSIQCRHHRGGGMDRRAFLELLAAAPLAPAVRAEDAAPSYRVASRYAPAAVPGMPGPWPGRVVSVRSPRCLDEAGAWSMPTWCARWTAGCEPSPARPPPRTVAAFLRATDVVGIKERRRGAPRGLSPRHSGRDLPPAHGRGRRAPASSSSSASRTSWTGSATRRTSRMESRSSPPRPATDAWRTARTTRGRTWRWTSSARRTRAPT
jgi:hypothetical protein